ncbi:MAG: TraB/GumN family protein [Spirochaetes bacterium]|nr:TraB/GumN family protein [Spirochaetota bacterium]
MDQYQKPEVNEISQNVHQLTFADGKVLYLIGTAHVSAHSVELVEKTIENVNPDTIAVELDPERLKSLKEKSKVENIDIIQIIKEKRFFLFIGQLLLSSFQKKISAKTGSSPGMEFKKAAEIAAEKGLKLVLADRNIGTTMKRAWRMTNFVDKMKILATAFFGDEGELEDVDIEELKSHDAINSMMESFAEELPVVKQVLIDERDQYLAYEIFTNLGDTTVAVVGAGHVPGMLKLFENKIEPEIKEKINYIPPPSLLGKIFPYLISVIIVGVIVAGFFLGGKETGKDAILYWVLANGTLTALGCLIALGHPLTIIAGFLAAPITSLNPTIGAGIVTGLVQTFLVRPRVRDFEQIHNHDLKIVDWWKNRLTRILLVLVLGSIGSTIGTFWGFGLIMKLLGS